MKEPRQDGFDFAIMLVGIVAIVLVCVIGFLQRQTDNRVKELSYQVVLLEKETATLTAKDKAVTEILAQLQAKPPVAPDNTENVERLMMWAQMMEVQIGMAFEQLAGNDHVLASWIQELQAEVAALKAIKPPAAAEPPPVAKPKPSLPKAKKVRRNYTKKAKRKPCPPARIVCKGENPIICTMR